MQRLSLTCPLVIGAALALAATVAGAQEPPSASAPDNHKPVEQRSEVITHQDAGSRIQELRVGGETRHIDVQTNSRVPGYQVKPSDNATEEDTKGSAGKTSWKVLNF